LKSFNLSVFLCVSYYETKEILNEKASESENFEEVRLSMNLKNKFKLLLKDISIISSFLKDSLNNPMKDFSLIDIIMWILRNSLKRNTEKYEDFFLSHLLLLVKINEFWARFLLPNYFAAFIKESLEEEIEFRMKLSAFLNKNIEKEQFLNILETNYKKIVYPMNLVICESLINGILDFNNEKIEDFEEYELYLNKIVDFSRKALNLDEKTVYYIANSIIFDQIFKPKLLNSSKKKEIFIVYTDFLNKFMKIFRLNALDENLYKDNEILACLEGIRYKRSKAIFESISRFFIDPKQFFNEYEDLLLIPLFSQLLYFSFEGQ